MELDKFGIGDQRAGLVGHGQRFAARLWRIGRDPEQAAGPARAQYGLAGSQRREPALRVARHDAGNPAIGVLQQADRAVRPFQLNVPGVLHGGGQRAHDRLAGQVPGDTGDAGMRVCGLQ